MKPQRPLILHPFNITSAEMEDHMLLSRYRYKISNIQIFINWRFYGMEELDSINLGDEVHLYISNKLDYESKLDYFITCAFKRNGKAVIVHIPEEHECYSLINYLHKIYNKRPHDRFVLKTVSSKPMMADKYVCGNKSIAIWYNKDTMTYYHCRYDANIIDDNCKGEIDND